MPEFRIQLPRVHLEHQHIHLLLREDVGHLYVLHPCTGPVPTIEVQKRTNFSSVDPCEPPSATIVRLKLPFTSLLAILTEFEQKSTNGRATAER